MKILTLHCDYIRFKPLKKAFKNAEELSKERQSEQEVKDVLVILTAVEKGDNDSILKQMLDSVRKTASEVKSKNVVIYPYAHLSSNLANPETALEYLVEAEHTLKKEFNVIRAPFGHYKQFELKVKGHPLSELSRHFAASELPGDGNVKLGKAEEKILVEKYDPSKLLREMSKNKLDTSKLKDNDHRILGQKLDLFSFHEVAPGMPFWHDNGLHIYNKLKEFIAELLKEYNYDIIDTPQITDSKLFKISGHWDHYRENMLLTKYEDRDFCVKPMNCPGAMLVYRTKPRSYKELPLRLSEFGLVHRKELSGVLAGLFRVNRFTQDDAHIFCTKEQIGTEIANMLEMIKTIYKDTFGFDYSFELSTKPDKSMGDKKDWDYAEKVLEDALKKSKAKYKLNKGDGAFYGPKIDIHIQDSLGRSWQCATIQLDMQIPRRFELTYIDEKSKEETPFVIHRAILGSLERFIGVLLEHLNGHLPLWLSPRQIRVVSFTDRNVKACKKFVSELKDKIPGMRIEEDYRSDTVQSKIRDAEMLKVNYIIVIGDKEEENKTIAVRASGKKPEFGIKTEKFFEKLRDEINLKN